MCERVCKGPQIVSVIPVQVLSSLLLGEEAVGVEWAGRKLGFRGFYSENGILASTAAAAEI